MTKKRVVAFAVLMVTAGASITTVAMNGKSALEDGKSYPGALCLPDTQNAPIFRSTINGSISNEHDVLSLNVICPVVRDHLAGHPSGIVSGSLSASDFHPSKNVGCAIRSRSEDGGFVDSFTDITSGTGGQVLTFGALPSVANGIYVLECTIPDRELGASSTIQSYRVIERRQ